MKNVLIITYYWPPGSSPGVQRYLKFSKYLKDYNWNPIILTVENGAHPSYDETLLNDINKETNVYKTKTREPFKIYNFLKGKKSNNISMGMIGLNEKKSLFQKLSLFIRANFFIPDARKGWLKYALKEVDTILKENKIDAFITTGPPMSVHLIGLEIKRKYKIPWVSDFRDPWTSVYYNEYLPRTKRTKKIDKMYEDSVLSNSDSVVVVANGMKQEFSDRNKSIDVIYNGYDMSDIKNINNLHTDKFTMSYVGNFKPNQNIYNLWEGLEELVNEDKIDINDLLIEFTGNVDAGTIDYIKTKKIKSQLIINDFSSHDVAVSKMINSNLLIFVIPKSKTQKLIVTGKLFEYLASLSPILSIGPIDGEASHIINKFNRDKMLSYDDKEGIKKTIMCYYSLWKKNHNKFIHKKSDISNFSRFKLTGNLAEVLNKVYYEKN
ncbi:MAG: hypothetical protein CMP58_04660 [Flavobacteriales bacterium]|nr:hypothetical protein [Flavobacteriales bacterium]